MSDRLHAYLQSHWAAATAGVATFEQTAHLVSGIDPGAAADLRVLAEEVAVDREKLRELMTQVGLRPATLATWTGRLTATAQRILPPLPLPGDGLTPILRIDGLRGAVAGKRAGWDLLREVAEYDDRLDAALLIELAERADDQAARLQRIHLQVGNGVMRERARG